ncbi:MAG: hypothetical protein CL859_07305 [Cyanobium sp. ARS6]|nr:hypothetical protein [Cyanobium sp. ARS6]|tara:strand:- start:9691 stop:10278 length:588 start_codon:yes stop_codon:yes gene_type:complete
MTQLLDLPSDILLKIDSFAREDGGAVSEVWAQLTIYEHRIKHQRVVVQAIISNMTLSRMEFLNAYAAFRKVPGISVYARRENSGTYTFQLLCVGYATYNALFKGSNRFLYSVIESGQLVIVDELHDARTGLAFGGKHLTLVAPTQFKRGNPTVRLYEMRVGERTMPGSHALLGTCHAMKDLLTRYFVYSPSSDSS